MESKANYAQTFKIICDYLKPQINSVISDNDYEFEKKFAAAKNTVISRFGPEVPEAVLSKMMKDLEFQVRVARHSALNKKTASLVNKTAKKAKVRAPKSSRKTTKISTASVEVDSEREFYKQIQAALSKENDTKVINFSDTMAELGLSKKEAKRRSYLANSGFLNSDTL